MGTGKLRVKTLRVAVASTLRIENCGSVSVSTHEYGVYRQPIDTIDTTDGIDNIESIDSIDNIDHIDSLYQTT